MLPLPQTRRQPPVPRSPYCYIQPRNSQLQKQRFSEPTAVLFAAGARFENPTAVDWDDPAVLNDPMAVVLAPEAVLLVEPIAAAPEAQ